MNKISINNLVPDPLQPRQEFDRVRLSQLERSIEEKGIINPLIVEKYEKGKYLIIDGERRYRASKNIGLKEVPVEIIEPMTIPDRMIMRFHLQEQHENWSIFDRARAIATFKDVEKLTNTETANLLGMSASVVVMWTNILRLSKRSQAFINERRIPYSYTQKINRLSNIYEEFTDMPRQEIEMKLLRKYEDKILRDMNQFKALIRIGVEGDKKILIEFLKSPKMNVHEVLNKTIVGEEIKLDVIAYKARALTTEAKKVDRNKTGEITPFQKQMFHNLTETFKKILNS